MNLNNLKLSTHLIKISVPASQKAQDIMMFFENKSVGADELKRIELAKSLCQAWKKEKIPFAPPSVIERNDYWYLVQLFFLNRHINKNNRPYIFDLGKSENIIIDKFQESDFQAGKILKFSELPFLTKLLCQQAGTMNIESIFSRDGIDIIINKFGNSVLDELGISTKEFKISLIPYDIYLRLTTTLNLGEHKMNVFFDGFRLRTDGVITGLFGGNNSFGGASFIDSLWRNSVNYSIVPRLIIVRKNYGN